MNLRKIVFLPVFIALLMNTKSLLLAVQKPIVNVHDFKEDTNKLKELKKLMLCIKQKDGCSKKQIAAIGAIAISIIALISGGSYVIYQKYKSVKNKSKELEELLSFDKEAEVIAPKYNIDKQDARKVLAYFKEKYGNDYQEKLAKDLENYNDFLNKETRRNSDFYNALAGRDLWVEYGYIFIKLGFGPESFIKTYKYAIKDKDEAQSTVNAYKIHLMPQPKDINKIFATLIKNEDIIARSQWVKVKSSLKNTASSENIFPIVAIYVPGRDKANEVLNKICALFKNMEGNGITPRYNQKVTDLIYFAQGNGDDKKRIDKEGSEYADLKKYYEQPELVYYSKNLNELGGNPNYKLDYSSC